MRRLAKDLVFVTLLLAMTVFQAAAAPSRTPEPFRTIPAIDGALVRSPADLPDVRPGLESVLSQLLDAFDREGLASAELFAAQREMVVTDGQVQVVLVGSGADVVAAIGEAVIAAGGRVQSSYENLVQAMVPIEALETLRSLKQILLIREPHRPEPDAGSYTTQGVAASGADTWHTHLAGWDGTGVKVAIVDSGFYTYTNLLGTDLPATVTTHDETGIFPGTSEHGTACAEIVHDMAPGASLYLVKIGTDVDFGNAVTWLIGQGVDVISMSLSWQLDGPGDGTGSLANIVNNARTNGILFITSAGNDRLVNWHGLANISSGLHIWDGATQNINYFGPGDGSAYVIPAGYSINVGLHWNDWTAVTQNYDMELYRWTGSGWTFVTGSYNLQNGTAGQTPEESISWITTVAGPYGIIVTDSSTTWASCLRLRASNSLSQLDESVPSRSMGYPNDSPDAMAVAAVDVTSYLQEIYSSEGPNFGPGGSCTGGLTKPEIAGYANVDTASYGPGVFNGTSAATPHVAGAAALYIQAYTSTTGGGTPPTVAQTQTYLENHAIDLGTPGKDTLYGSGRVALGLLGPTAIRISQFGAQSQAGLPLGLGALAVVTGLVVVLRAARRRSRE